MSALSPVLRQAEGGVLMFWCPGCNEAHSVRVGVSGRPCWTWNGNAEQPTFEPSVLVQSGHYASAWKPGDPCWCTYAGEDPDDPDPFACHICHSFVRGGRIEFLGDSTHHLAGQTVPLPPWPER